MAAHTQWRLFLTRTSSGFATSIASIIFYDGSHTLIPTTGGSPSASSNTTIANLAFDSDPSTFWFSASGAQPLAPQWIEYQFASPVDVASIDVVSQPAGGILNQAPLDIALQYFDGAVWVQQNFWSGIFWNAFNQTRSLTASNAFPATIGVAFRLFVTANAGFSNGTVALSEWQIFDPSNNPIATPRYADLYSTVAGGEPDGGYGAFDSDLSTYWASDAFGFTPPGTPPILAQPQWLVYTFSDPSVYVANFCLVSRPDSLWSQAPGQFQLQISTDGAVTWTTLGSFSASWSGPGQTTCGFTVPHITCDSPPAGTVGTAYTHTFPVTSGTAPYTFSITAGSLPTGLTLNTSTGVVSGTPSAPGTSTFTIQVTDAHGSIGFVSCSITINPAPTPTISCNAPPVGTIGIAYSHNFPASGGTPPYTYAITAGSLPPGLTLNTSTGTVAGIPTTAGNYPFTIQVTDSNAETASANCSITINPPGLFINCDSPPTGTVGVSYTHNFPASGGVPPYSFAITSGSLPTGLNLDPSTGTVSGIPISAGTFPFTIQVTDSLSTTASANCSITINPPGLQVSCNFPPTATVGTFYIHAFVASGGTPPYTFSIISGALPNGLILDDSTGIVAGTPTTPGTFPFTIQVMDSLAATATANCNITVNSVVNPPPVPTCDNPPPGQLGVIYIHNFSATGGTLPYTFSISAGELPPGLTMDSAGHVTGTPVGLGTFPFTLKAVDGIGNSGTVDCSITILGMCPCCSIPNRGAGNLPVGPYVQGPLVSSPPQPPPSNWNTADGSLQGAVDGVNTVYTTGVQLQRARVWLNGVFLTLNVDVVASGPVVRFLKFVPQPAHLGAPADIVKVQGWVQP